LKKARKWSTTVVVHVARKPRQNRPIVRKLLPCSAGDEKSDASVKMQLPPPRAAH